MAQTLKLTCTANDLKPFAEAAGLDPPVHRWDVDERPKLLAELDAAYFLLYGIGRDDVGYILSTFAGLCSEAPTLLSGTTTTARILDAYDRLHG